MAKYSQTERPMAVTTPLGADVMLLERISGKEALSEPFNFRLDMLAQVSEPIEFDKLLGQPVTVEIRSAQVKRYIHGIVSKLIEGRQVRASMEDTIFFSYRAEVVPKFWLFTRQQNSRIFQQKSVKEILTELLVGFTVEWKTEATYEKRDFCVQYRETDFDFCSRLMEEEGIYYFFEHTDSDHKMIIADSLTALKEVNDPGMETTKEVLFRRPESGRRAAGDELEHRVEAWEKAQEIRSGKFALWDQCFEKVTGGKHDNFESLSTIAPTAAAGTITHKLAVGVNDKLEIYDYPGAFAQRFDGIDPGGSPQAAELGKIPTDGTRTVKIRMEQEAIPGLVVIGASSCPHMITGYKFKLVDHFDADGEYYLAAIDHTGSIEGAYTGGRSDIELKYSNRFRAVPAAVPFRPERKTPRPTVKGTQTALVVGPSGEEIFTDKYSRVKVHFHWDRLGKLDQTASCWVRVGTPWAGKQWGMIHIPRIGQEVIVDFLEGDPDQPLIVGSVYNAEQMPPYLLPDNKTQSGMKSRSSLKGDDTYFNELRFEDLKDKEHVYFHAQKDFSRVVEYMDALKIGFGEPEKESKLKDGSQTIDIFNNQTTKIGTTDCVDGSQAIVIWNNQTLDIGCKDATKGDGDQTVTIFNNHTLKIGCADAKDGSQAITVWKNQVVNIGCADSSGGQTITVFKDRVLTVTEGNETITISKGNRDIVVSEGNTSFTVTKGTHTVTIEGDTTETIKTGKRAITVDTANYELGVTSGDIKAKADAGNILIEAGTKIELKVGANSITIDASGVVIKGTGVTCEGTGTAEMKSPATTIKGDGMLTLKGGMVMIN
jgi:type VI secretion system secreted protein VgrG